MKYYSTKTKIQPVGLIDAVADCVAPDGGLYLPQTYPKIPAAFLNNLSDMSLREIAYATSNVFLAPDIDSKTTKEIVDQALAYDVPLVEIAPGRLVLELFHGPTMAFKDFGAGFMAELCKSVGAFDGRKLNILVATTGNTGAAVAYAFRNMPNVNVFALIPRGVANKRMVSEIASYGQHIHVIEVAGTIDDCRKMASEAFVDARLREQINITSANSINIAGIIPQVAFYFYLYGRLIKKGYNPREVDIALPSGNMSMITAGTISRKMGLALGTLIAACNANNAFDEYLHTGKVPERPVVATLAQYMDTARPLNIPRLEAIYHNDLNDMRADISSAVIGDQLIREQIRSTYESTSYIADPHAAAALAALDLHEEPSRPGVVFATASPAKSALLIKDITGVDLRQKAPKMAKAQPDIVSAKMIPSYRLLRKFILSKQ